MARSIPDTSAIVAAFAARAGLELSDDERPRLDHYAQDMWDMADHLRSVETPGMEGQRDQLPLRTAYCNRGANGASTGPSATMPAGARQAAPAGVHEPGLVESAEALAQGEVTPLDLTNAMLDRIDRYDGALRSYITVDAAGALAAAQALTAELQSQGPRSLLHGVPIGAKDNIPIAGMACTYNSPLTKDWHPKRDSEVARRLREAGAVLVGKHNLNEFGWSLPAETDVAPPPRNPWMPEEFAIGSSSGGGVAVASRLAYAALGTDGGGSTRLPAGQNSLFGLKPTRGRVPGAGVSGGTLSEVGVLARHAVDVAAVLAALLIDPEDADAAQRRRTEPVRWVDYVSAPAQQLRIGVPEAFLADVGMEDDVADALAATRRICAELGFELVPIGRDALDVLHDARRANFVILASEHYFDQEGPGADRSRYGASAGFYNLPGSCLTASDYLHGLRVGAVVRNAVDAVLEQVDVILTPTSPVTLSSTARDPKTHHRGGNAAYTAPFNLSGHPGISFPVGLTQVGMPIGMQFIGRPDSEFDLIRAASTVSAGFELPSGPDLEAVRASYGGR